MSATYPVISAGGLCVQQGLAGSLDGDRLVPTAAAVSALGAVPVPPVPGEQSTTRGLMGITVQPVWCSANNGAAGHSCNYCLSVVLHTDPTPRGMCGTTVLFG